VRGKERKGKETDSRRERVRGCMIRREEEDEEEE
jgi:hypothetical protein